MLKKVKSAIKKYGMIEKGDRIVVAVSGGPDSMALLTCLNFLSYEYDIHLFIAHLNHGIRQEHADRDEQFVRQISQNMGIPFESKRIHVPSLKRNSGKSLEEIGREERYRFLINVTNHFGAQKIALGHHLQDQTETIVMNFLRGSGSEGLKGMLPFRDGMLIRPLLYIKKNEILEYLEEQKVPYVIDNSNENIYYLRNRLRHELLPGLRHQYNPSLDETLGRMSEIMRLENDYMEKATVQAVKNLGLKLPAEEIVIKKSEFMNNHPAVQNRIIKKILISMTPSGSGIGYPHIKAVTHLATGSNPGSEAILPCNIHVRREYEWIKFTQIENNFDSLIDKISYPVSIPDTIHVKELNVAVTFEIVDKPGYDIKLMLHNPVYMDFEKIIPPLSLRTVRPGDRIQPSGMIGTKKLKSYFIDQKIPKNKRGKILILVDCKSVIWIAGMRLSERVSVKENSKKFLKVEIV
jgi:tRNA(Ile)-lysidine synthase